VKFQRENIIVSYLFDKSTQNGGENKPSRQNYQVFIILHVIFGIFSLLIKFPPALTENWARKMPDWRISCTTWLWTLRINLENVSSAPGSRLQVHSNPVNSRFKKALR